MVGQDVAFSGTCCALHGMTNTVLLMLMTWVPFGDSGKLAYEAHLTATSAATLSRTFAPLPGTPVTAS